MYHAVIARYTRSLTFPVLYESTNFHWSKIMPKATWNGHVIAESDKTVVVEGTHYFPADSLKMDLLQKTATTSVCGWKGTANYYSVVVDGQENKDAAWYYAEPKDAAKEIAGHVAFWKGVTVA